MKTEKYTERQFKLMKFYSVHNLEDLVEKQAEHIAKLQSFMEAQQGIVDGLQDKLKKRKVRDGG